MDFMMFAPVVFALIGIGILVIGPWFKARFRRKPSPVMEHLAVRHNLAIVERGLFDMPVLEGTVDGHEVRVVPLGGSSVSPTRYQVTVDSVLPTDTEVTRPRNRDAYGDPLTLATFATGDPDFDRVVAIQAAGERAVTSYLSAPVREALAAAVGENVTIGRDKIWAMTDTDNPGATEVATLIQRVVSVANAFRGMPLGEAERLAHNALNDPKQAVRDKNAKLLFARYKLSRAIVGVADAWATFEDPEIWVAAARVLEPDRRVPVTLRVLRDVARGQRLDRNQLVAARLLADVQPDAPRLRALTPSLLVSLDRNEPITNGTAAAVTLGRYAGIDVVPALRAAVDRLGRAAREAIADIQSRHTGTPGQLSVVAEAAQSGGLSEVETESSERGPAA